MTSGINLVRTLIIFGICVPLALFVGYLLADPMGYVNIATMGMILFAISLPLWMRWHHMLMVACLNSTLVAFFLPGQQPLWVPAVLISLFFSIINRTLRKESQFIAVPSVSRPLIVMALIVLGTAIATQGIGGAVLGGENWGGKRYLTTFGAIIGYFALVAVRIPPEKSLFYASLFFLAPSVAIASDVLYVLGPKFWLFYIIFNPDVASLQAITQDTLNRLVGVAVSTTAVVVYLFMRFGIRGLFDLSRPLRLGMFLLFLPLSLLGGFRTTPIFLGLLFMYEFYYERLMRTWLLPATIGISILMMFGMVVLSDRLPLSVQRSISFLPLKLNPVAQKDAAESAEWRLTMWKAVMPEIPKYLLVGKGFAYSSVDYYLTQQAVIEGKYEAFESTLVSGNYHNGMLTVLIPFGLAGLLCFLWFGWSAFHVLRANYRYGPARLKQINTFILSYFMARLTFYFTVYGQFDMDLALFAGLVGLSISLNGGVYRPPTLPAEQRRFVPTPLVRKAPEPEPEPEPEPAAAI